MKKKGRRFLELPDRKKRSRRPRLVLSVTHIKYWNKVYYGMIGVEKVIVGF